MKNLIFKHAAAVALLAIAGGAQCSPLSAFEAANGGEAAGVFAGAPDFSLSNQAVLAATAEQPAASSNNEALLSSGGFELTLWNFIANIRAQQLGEHFELLQTSVASIDYTLGPVLAPVPLPAGVWLFVVGALGLFGSRFTLARQPGSEPSAALQPAA